MSALYTSWLFIAPAWNGKIAICFGPQITIGRLPIRESRYASVSGWNSVSIADCAGPMSVHPVPIRRASAKKVPLMPATPAACSTKVPTLSRTGALRELGTPPRMMPIGMPAYSFTSRRTGLLVEIVGVRTRVRCDRDESLFVEVLQRLPAHFRVVARGVADIVRVHEHRRRVVVRLQQRIGVVVEALVVVVEGEHDRLFRQRL